MLLKLASSRRVPATAHTPAMVVSVYHVYEEADHLFHVLAPVEPLPPDEGPIFNAVQMLTAALYQSGFQQRFTIVPTLFSDGYVRFAVTATAPAEWIFTIAAPPPLQRGP